MKQFNASQKLDSQQMLPLILLVDDEPNILKSLKRLLRGKPFNLVTATTAREALTILAENEVQVMLTDHKMPNMTGAQLIDIVHQQHPNIVSIMLSGQVDYDHVIRLLNDRLITRFIKKPWCGDELVATIEKAVTKYEENN